MARQVRYNVASFTPMSSYNLRCNSVSPGGHYARSGFGWAGAGRFAYLAPSHLAAKTAAPKDGLLKCVNNPVVVKRCRSCCAEGLKTDDCHPRAANALPWLRSNTCGRSGFLWSRNPKSVAFVPEYVIVKSMLGGSIHYAKHTCNIRAG